MTQLDIFIASSEEGAHHWRQKCAFYHFWVEKGRVYMEHIRLEEQMISITSMVDDKISYFDHDDTTSVNVH